MEFILWIGFILLIVILLALDLGVFHKKEHIIETKEALMWTGFWIFIAMLFTIFIYYAYENHWFGIGLEVGHNMNGNEAVLKYITGYIIEKTLSLDNIFVIALVFSYFNIPLLYQHRVLFWGILGALIMRGIMILAGAALIKSFVWMIYVFGGFLIITAIKMLFHNNEEIHPEKNILIRFFKKLYPVTNELHGHNFFVNIDGKKAITPLFLVLLVVESTDVVFAVDSIPAIFAVTTDPFIVFTSNVFAILGLRSLYFALAALMNKFKYLKYSLVFVLAFVGVKMIISHHYPIPTILSLIIISTSIAMGIFISIFKAPKTNGN